MTALSIVHAGQTAVVPLAHVHTFCAHSRSCVALGAFVSYWCDAHVLCVAHVRSLETVGATFSYSPSVHTSALVHASPLLWLEKLVPSLQSSHSRSFVLLGARLWPLPTAHVFHGVPWP